MGEVNQGAQPTRKNEEIKYLNSISFVRAKHFIEMQFKTSVLQNKKV